LPKIKSAQKRFRSSERRRGYNKPVRSATKTYITKAENLIFSNQLDSAWEAIRLATAALDKAAQKGVIHPNNAARHKSRLMKKLNAAKASASVN